MLNKNAGIIEKLKKNCSVIITSDPLAKFYFI
jgi:hypothetical protein